MSLLRRRPSSVASWSHLFYWLTQKFTRNFGSCSDVRMSSFLQSTARKKLCFRRTKVGMNYCKISELCDRHCIKYGLHSREDTSSYLKRWRSDMRDALKRAERWRCVRLHRLPALAVRLGRCDASNHEVEVVKSQLKHHRLPHGSFHLRKDKNLLPLRKLHRPFFKSKDSLLSPQRVIYISIQFVHDLYYIILTVTLCCVLTEASYSWIAAAVVAVIALVALGLLYYIFKVRKDCRYV